VADEEGELQPIIVKKIVKGGGHHGGAWKVAYADFVTAMMAFFLLLWLLNVTTEEQKNAISNYFDPTHPQVSDSTSGAGGVLGGLSVAPDGAMVTNVQSITYPSPSGSAINNKSSKKQKDKEHGEGKGHEKSPKEMAIEKAKEVLRQREQDRMEKAKAALQKAVDESPELKALKENLIIDITPEGLRIQVIDQEKKPMFASGSARMFEKTRLLLDKVGEVINKEPNDISVRGHTDSIPYGRGAKYTNWDLSADRANSSRRALVASGFPGERVHDVVGKSDTEHLFPEEPERAGNRRISIILLKEELTNPDFNKKAEEEAAEEIEALEKAAMEEDSEDIQDAEFLPPPSMPKIGTFRKTPGAVEFP
jgi:chemotaxis protein MotB